jgi:tetratricopeptide (TPR) repeat protein
VQRYRVPITILAVALAVFVAVIGIALYTQQRTNGAGTLPSEFKALLNAGQLQALDAITTLQSTPDDPEALLKMANYYFDSAEQARITGNQSALFQFGPQGIRYFLRYLAVAPQDNDARADLATLLFYNGQTDRAIQEVGKVLSTDANHINGNFNLGIFLAQGRRDFPAAAKQFEKVIALTEDDPNRHSVYQAAVALLEQAKKAEQGSGGSIESSGAAL